MTLEAIQSLERQNRMLKTVGGLSMLVAGVALFVAAAPQKVRYTEIDAERINIVRPDGKLEMVIANRDRLPKPITDGKELPSDRQMPGLIFFNGTGDECGGLIYDGKPDAQGNPRSGMHFSMDRFGGDQQLALGHYEAGGTMETGLNVYDSGRLKDSAPLYEALKKAPEGAEKEEARRKWEEAGGPQVRRVFVGKTRGRSSVLILADAKGRPRIRMMVSPEGEPSLQFLGEKGEVTQSFAGKGTR